MHLHVRDIDSTRMMIRVEHGKGAKNRYTVLSTRLLEALRGYFLIYRPLVWLFPAHGGDRPMHPTSLQRAYQAAKRRAGITKPGGIHGLRHAFATHLPGSRCRCPHDSAIARPRRHHDHDSVFPLDQARADRPELRSRSARAALRRRRRANPVCAVPSGTAVSSRPRLELADIVRAHGDVYRRTHGLARVQHRALHAIETCRTAVLGGHRATCDRCGAVRITYNSCRNRHCPKCQTLTKERWLAARRADLLPIPYFHVVFTLPHALNALAQGNPRVIYTLLFRAAADTLLTFGRDPRHLGGLIGITAILHTWGQNLSAAPPSALSGHRRRVDGGPLTMDCRAIDIIMFPVRALSRVFRGKYLAGLQRAFDAGQLTFAGGTADLADRRAFTDCLGQLRAVDWIVYPEAALRRS